jgi:NAD(P)-dependent dehydrogenase (short-subunit alcohol dehydrogenase family)
LAGRVYVITGASGALGSTVAKAVVGQGCRVVLIDHIHETPHGLVDGENVLILGGVDLTDDESAKAAIDAAAARFGGLDAVLNIAGGFSWEAIEGGDPNTWRKLFRLNVETCANVCRAAIPHLKRSKAGRIVNVGANGAVKAGHGMGAYAASKAGVHRLTEALADELKGSGVTVNAVLPSIIDTPANRADMPKANFATWVTPEELTAVMLFLTSEKASAVTGALVPVVGRV